MYIYKKLQFGLKVVNLAMAVNDIHKAFIGGDSLDIMKALLKGFVAVAAFFDLCDLGTVGRITKFLASGASFGISGIDFYQAYEEGDVWGMIKAGVSIAVSLIVMFAACFTGDTPVATEDGFKRIDELQVGDHIWAYHVETGKTELKEVKEVFVKETDEILHLETTVGNIATTTNHPFYVADKGWVAAGDLQAGDEIRTLSGESGFVIGFEVEKLDEPIVVYNLEVDGFHSYFVGEAGVLVHNAYRADYLAENPNMPSDYSTSWFTAKI